MNLSLTDEIRATRDQMKEFRHEGKFFPPEEVEGLVRRLNTFIEMASEIEDELKLITTTRTAGFAGHERRLVSELRKPKTNVVALIADRRQGSNTA